MASSELTEAKTILGILSDTRAEHYDSWFIIGSILYNLSKGKEPGISLWHDFTKRGTMFSKEDCNDKWSTMRKSPYSIRMLFQYAQQDHMQCFEEYKINRSKKKLKEACRSIDTGEYVFAEALYYLCCDEFTYNDSWYQYRDNTWAKTKNYMELKKKIQCLKGFIMEDNKLLRDRRTIVSDLIRDKEDENEMDQADTLRMEVKTIENKLAIYTVVLEKLNTAGFKNAIMSECKELFYDDTLKVENTITIENDTYVPPIEVINPIYVYDEFYEQMKQKQWKPSSTTWKRVHEIINDFELKKCNTISRKLKTYFTSQHVKIVEDRKHGHKIYIEY